MENNYSEITAFGQDALDILQPDEEEEDVDVVIDDIDSSEDDEIYDIEVEDEEDEAVDDDVDEEEEDTDVDDEEDIVEAIELPDGTTLSIEDIIELQQGNLRQADYTRKTQQLAKDRKELEQLKELRDFLLKNPQLVSQLYDGYAVDSPELSGILSGQKAKEDDLYYRIRAMELDKEVDRLRDKYGEIDEVELYERATDLGTQDLESVYKLIVYENGEQNQTISADDLEALKEEIRQETIAELTNNRDALRTTVKNKGLPQKPRTVSVSRDEMRVADGLGMSVEEYLKWRG